MFASIFPSARIRLGIALFFQGCAAILAQNHSSEVEYNFRRISMQDGLANQIITAVCEDNKGMLWFGTHGGLYRFDGFRVMHFIDKSKGFLPHEFITDLEYLSTSNGSDHLLICTPGKGWLLDIATDQLVPFETLGFPRKIFDACSQIKRQGDNIYWAIADSALYRIVRIGPKQYSTDILGPAPDAPVTKIVPSLSDSGGIWLLPAEQEVYHVSADGIYTHYSLPWFNNNPTPIAGLLGLIQTPSGLIGWDYAQNLYRWNPIGDKFEMEGRQTLQDLFPSIATLDRSYKQRNVLRLHRTLSTGQEVIGTTLGLFTIQKRSNQFRVPEGMVGSEVRGILTDSFGNWWAGTYTGFFQGNLSQKGIRHVSSIQGVWGGIPLDTATWMLVCENKNGIFVLNKPQNNVRKPALPAPMKQTPASALSICRDHAGHIWVGTYTNLYWSPPEAPFDLRPLLNTGTTTPSVRAVFFRALLPDQNSGLWACAENGLFHLRYSHSPEHYTIDTVLRDISVSDVYADRFDNLWIATKGKGVARYDRAGNTFTWFDTEHGLASNYTCRIEGSDDDRVLWISTHDGLARLDVPSGIVHNYHEEDGIPGNEFNSAASARSPDGTLLFGGVAGLVHFHPDSLCPPSFRYKTIISQVHVHPNGSDSAVVYHVPNALLLLSPYPRLVEVYVGVNDFVQAAKTRFRYRIAGMFSNWVYTDGENKIRLFNLAPGDYTLEVQAMPYDGHVGESARLNIIIAQPYSETWWFQALILAIIFLLAYLAYRNRLRQALRTYILRQQIADDLHDEIGNKLNITGILIQKTRNSPQENAPSAANETLDKLLEINRDTLLSLRTLIWSVDPKKDHLHNLFARMQDFTDDYLQPLNIRCLFSLPSSIPDNEIRIDVRHNLIMIYQELLTNMIKHAPPKELNISLTLTANNSLILILTNTLQPLEQSKFNTTSGNLGLDILQRRLNKIEGTILSIETHESSQKIALSFPHIFKL